MTIRVNNLPPQVAESDLTQLFSDYGSVEGIKIFEAETAALVTLSGNQEEDAAISALNDTEWRGNTLELVLEADTGDGTRDPGGPPTGGGGGSSGGG